jgi:hypothetical protein
MLRSEMRSSNKGSIGLRVPDEVWLIALNHLIATVLALMMLFAVGNGILQMKRRLKLGVGIFYSLNRGQPLIGRLCRLACFRDFVPERFRYHLEQAVALHNPKCTLWPSG